MKPHRTHEFRPPHNASLPTRGAAVSAPPQQPSVHPSHKPPQRKQGFLPILALCVRARRRPFREADGTAPTAGRARSAAPTLVAGAHTLDLRTSLGCLWLSGKSQMAARSRWRRGACGYDDWGPACCDTLDQADALRVVFPLGVLGEHKVRPPYLPGLNQDCIRISTTDGAHGADGWFDRYTELYYEKSNPPDHVN